MAGSLKKWGAIALVGSVVGIVPAGAAAETPAQDYEHARAQYYELKAHPEKQRFRHYWLPVIARFAKIGKRHPKSEEAPKALYTEATLRHDLYEISRSKGDLSLALERYNEVATNYPTSSLADDALYQRALLLRRCGRDEEAHEDLRRLLKEHPAGDMAARARQQVKSSPDSEPKVMTKNVVVIDPGHGGKDRGATGHRGLEEARVNLEIAKRLAKRLRAGGFDVFLTRSTDETVALDDRTEFARNHGAELFVSIHANAADTPKAHGIETYYLDVTHDRYSKRLAHRENDGSKEPSELGLILADLATKVSARESRALAVGIQKRLVRAARSVNKTARDLGAKAAMLHVLLGARCPAVLVETAFVSNPTEAKMLARADYQNAVADALAEGIQAHFAEPLLARGP